MDKRSFLHSTCLTAALLALLFAGGTEPAQAVAVAGYGYDYGWNGGWDGRGKDKDKRGKEKEEERSGEKRSMSLDDAVKLVQKRYKAQIVRTDTLRGDDGKTIYQFRLLNDEGRVWTVRVNAATGAVY